MYRMGKEKNIYWGTVTQARIGLQPLCPFNVLHFVGSISFRCCNGLAYMGTVCCCNGLAYMGTVCCSSNIRWQVCHTNIQHCLDITGALKISTFGPLKLKLISAKLTVVPHHVIAEGAEDVTSCPGVIGFTLEQINNKLKIAEYVQKTVLNNTLKVPKTHPCAFFKIKANVHYIGAYDHIFSPNLNSYFMTEAAEW